MQTVTGVDGSFEQFLVDKASCMEVPIGANLELIPICNMDCKMCYVRTDMREVNRLGGLPDMEMWLQLGKEMKEMGTLFVLLTGGEPLLYPYFKEVYRFYHELGFILTVNTNGTLIDEEWADFFSHYPPRRLNITIYGKDNETYHSLCSNPGGFNQLCRAVSLLQDRQLAIKLNCSLTVHNYEQWEELCRIAEAWDIPLDTAYYMMPPARKMTHTITDISSRSKIDEDKLLALRKQHDNNRLSPELAAQAAWKILTMNMSEEQKKEYVKVKLEQVEHFQAEEY